MMTDLMRYDDLKVTTELSDYEKRLKNNIEHGNVAPEGGANRLANAPLPMNADRLSVPSHGVLDVWFNRKEITIDDHDEFDCPQLIVPIGALKVTLPINVADSSFIVNFHVKLLQGGDVFYIPCRHIHTEESQSGVDYYLDVSTTLLESLTGKPLNRLDLYGGFHYDDEVTNLSIFIYDYDSLKRK
jgi:hypothetical protein